MKLLCAVLSIIVVPCFGRQKRQLGGLYGPVQDPFQEQTSSYLRAQQQQQQQQALVKQQAVIQQARNNQQRQQPPLNDIPEPKSPPERQPLTFAEASFVAGLGSEYNQKPSAPKPKGERKLSAKAVRALQNLPDESLVKIIYQQTKGKVSMTPEQVKEFKSTDPKTLATLINSGALTSDSAASFGNPAGVPAQVAPNGNNPQNPVYPYSNYPQNQFPVNGRNPVSSSSGFLQSRNNIPNAAFSGGGGPYLTNNHFGNGLGFPSQGVGSPIGGVRSGAPGAGGARPQVTLQQITLLRGLPEAQIKSIVKQKAGLDLTAEQVRMIKTLPPQQLVQMINSGQFDSGASPTGGDSLSGQPVSSSGSGGKQVTVEQIQILRGLPNAKIKEIVRKKTGRTLSNKEVRAIKTMPPEKVARMVNSGYFDKESKKSERNNKRNFKDEPGLKKKITAREIRMLQGLSRKKARKLFRERTGINPSNRQMKALDTLQPSRIAKLINNGDFTNKNLKKIMKKRKKH